MASVVLVSKAGVEFSVSSVIAFVNAVYANGAMPKTGSVRDNYEHLQSAAPPPTGSPNQNVTLAQLQDLLADKADSPVLDNDLPARLSEAALKEAFGSREVLPVDALFLGGHSYAAGVLAGGGSYEQSFGPVLAETLGLPLRNNGWGGSSLYSNDPTVALLRAVTRPAFSRFVSPGGLNALMSGLNDLNKLGNTPAALAAFRAALRAVVSRMRSGAIYEDDHASIAYQGAWANLAGAAYGTGSSVRYTGTTGTGFTITTPAAFPGGTVGVGLVSWTDGSGATVSTTVGGVSTSIDTKATARTDSAIHSVLRVPNVPAGAQTITFTVTGATGLGAILDYWTWECPPDEGPLVILVKQPKPIDYTAYGSTAPGPPTDAGVNALNTILDEVAAEFGHRVITVDTSSMDKDSRYFIAGNVHPTIAGHRRIAELIHAAITDPELGFTLRPGVDWRAPRIEYGTAAPTGPSRQFFVGDEVRNTAPAEEGTAGSKYVTRGWLCVTTGSPGTWVPMRTPTGN